MMRSLAEFIMRGRFRAILLVLLGIPIITPAVLGLVTLRRGSREGAILLLVGLLPALVGLLAGRPAQLMFWSTLLTLLAVMIPALILRSTRSWALTLMSLPLLTGLFVLMVISQAQGFTEGMSQFSDWLSESVNVSPEMGQIPFSDRAFMSGFLAYGCCFVSLASLVLARWWQALLYNPGGFGEEFRALRLPWGFSAICAGLAALLASQGLIYSFWASLVALPLVIVAVAIINYAAAVKNWPSYWPAIFIFMVIVISPMMLVLTIMGFVDSFIDIRRRFFQNASNQ